MLENTILSVPHYMFSFVFTIKIVTYYDINVNLNLWFIVLSIHNYADAELFAIQIWVCRDVCND